MKINELHIQNPHLQSIVAEFVVWYCKGDLKKILNIFEVTKAIGRAEVVQSILSQLHCELVRSQQTDTFEAFCLFNEVKRCLNSVQDDKAPLEQLKGKAPVCLRLLLASDHSPLRLVNKFFNAPLCVQHEKVLCCSRPVRDGEETCTAKVHPDTALTSFSFRPEDTCWKLEASATDGVAKVAWIGTQWKLKAVDEHHVKIFNDDGNVFLN